METCTDARTLACQRCTGRALLVLLPLTVDAEVRESAPIVVCSTEPQVTSESDIDSVIVIDAKLIAKLIPINCIR